MRVAHITDCYLPRTGGIEAQIRGLSHAQLAAGEQPLVITATPASKARAVIPGETDEGVPIERIAMRLPGQIPVTPHVGKRLREILLDRADVVHVHGGTVAPFAWPALRTAVRAGLPAVATIHSVWAGWSGWMAAADRAWGWCHWPVEWTAVSEVAAEGLRDALRGAAPVHVLPNGIDVDRWRPVQETAPPDSGIPPTNRKVRLLVVSVARFAPRKRMVPLVRLLDRARELLPPGVGIHAILVGDGPERRRVERWVRRHHLDWIECVGWQSHDQIRRMYSEADVFVAPARYESFGIAALEARTSGLAVVALSDSGTATFIRNGREGLLASDDDGMARALASLGTNPDLLGVIKAHNRGVAPDFSWPSIVRQARERYESACRLASGSRPR